MTDTLPPSVPASSTGGTVESKGLKGGALGLTGSVVVGLASTAPAYSLAASLGVVVATGAGLKAPAIMLLAFIPMYFIAVAYKELNEAEPDCGTTFTWATRAFGPIVGWMGGWGIIVADVIVMANLAAVAGAYSFTLADEAGIHNSLDSNTFWSTVAGLIWIAIMTYICYRGIEVSARIQYALLGIEVLTLISFAVVAFAKVYSGNATDGSLHPSLSWLWPSGMSFSGVLAPAVLAAVFIYWGWDTAVATNEEADDPGKTPGRAAVISTVLLLVIYVVVSIAVVAFAGDGSTGIGLANPDNSDDVFSALGSTLYGDSVIGKIGLALLAISILTSASASTQTTILPTARTALSMGVYRAIPAQFARIHPRYLTPTWATIGMGLVSAGFYLLMTWLSPDILLSLILAVGIQIAFYYGLTGIACIWFYRHTLTDSVRHLVNRGIIPALGGIFLFVMFVYATVQFAHKDYLQDGDGKNITLLGMGAVAVVGIGSLLFGFILLALQWRANPAYFQGRTLPKGADGDLLLYGENAPGADPITLPDSREATVIAPDLSNLPVGQVAVDPETGRRFTRSPDGTTRPLDPPTD
jgi:amino acid transporter